MASDALKVIVMQFPHGIVVRCEGKGGVGTTLRLAPAIGAFTDFCGQWLLSDKSLCLQKKSPLLFVPPPSHPPGRESQFACCLVSLGCLYPKGNGQP